MRMLPACLETVVWGHGLSEQFSEEGNQGHAISSFLHRIIRNYMKLPVGGLRAFN